MNNFKIEPEDIVIFHIGFGCGGSRHADDFQKLFPNRTVVYGFEPRDDDSNKGIEKYNRGKFINTAIAGSAGVHDFNINKAVSSSSMLKPNSKVCKEYIKPWVQDDWVNTWGDNTKLDKRVKISCITLKDFIITEGVTPDVLIIDAQGMELQIMRGMRDTFDKVKAVWTETEFFPIYTDQDLFYDHYNFLNRYDFRLADLYAMQRWRASKADGEGFLTVAQALWLKRLDGLCGLSDIDLIKQAAIAQVYNKTSYATAILKMYDVQLDIIKGFESLNKIKR